MNRAQCLICGMILESKYRHDNKSCTCGNLSVDGGNDYCKRSVRFPGKYLELSNIETEVEIESIQPTYESIQNILQNGVKK